jgi:MerR family transcriptional regulator, redox-sensitive transcriptional activator SoxR
MGELSIGEVARTAGLRPSALRYYEKAGLLPAPPRRARQRRYDAAIFGRIELIRLALAAGFTVTETRSFISGFAADTPPATRWRTLATRKLAEVNALMERVTRMKELLESSFRCRCPSLNDCERYLTARHQAAAVSRPAGRSPRASGI